MLPASLLQCARGFARSGGVSNVRVITLTTSYHTAGRLSSKSEK